MSQMPPNLNKLMQQAAEMQAEMQRRQDGLAQQTFTGTSGGGVVTAVVRGTGELISVSIDPSVLDPDDAEMVGDLVVAAVNQATAAMTDAMGDALGSVGGLDLSDLGGLLG